MKIVETGVATLLFMRIRKSDKHFSIAKSKRRQLVLIYATEDIHTTCSIKLPQVNWSSAIRIEDVTEEIAKTIIRDRGGKIFDYDPKHYASYEDFTLSDHPFDSRFFDNATESFQSLLKANDIYIVNPYEKPATCCSGRDCGCMGFPYNYHSHEELDKYYESEENTGNWIMLIKQK